MARKDWWSVAFVGLFSFAFFFLSTSDTEAALLYFDPSEVVVYRGDTVEMNLRIDTDEGECINTVDAVVHYDQSVRAVDVSRGDSILNLWVENPVIDENARTIKFAGGIPGGYCGRIPGDPRLTNTILKIIFRSPGLSIGGGNEQSARVWLDESSQVLLHDGYGTNAHLNLYDAKIKLDNKPGTVPSDVWNENVRNDDDLPSDFQIVLSKDETAFSGDYFIVFNSLDKQSGIDHYEVMEEPFSEFYAFKWGRADAPWIVTESPYVLKDQTLNSTIRVKAIDKAGNERVAVLVPDTALRSISRDALLTLIVFGGVLLVLGGLTFYALMRRKKRLLAQSSESYE